jgi:assimilatory nitrate reductase catalytic subunit
MRETNSTCCYCGVGCGVIIAAEGDRIVGVRGDPSHPANFGRLCTKGATLHLGADADRRALHPEVRRHRAQVRTRASWDDALELAATRFARAIQTHGPDSVAFYISGQLLTEDYYVFNKLAKGLVGTNNVDTNSRLCMSSAVAGYKLTLGADAPPACYEDIDHADCILIAGSNTAYAHPVLFRRIEDARARNPALKLIVLDPRRTDTAAAADLHLALDPGSDLAVLNAMLNVMIAEQLIDRDYIARHTRGFASLERMVRSCTPEWAAQIAGVDAADIVTAARWFGRAQAALSLYCQGLNQSTHGTHNNAAIIHLHLATGQLGRPGAGPLSLTGQPNAMGGREVGGLANLMSAHRELANPAHRAEIARLWGVAHVPAKPGLTAVELFDAMHTGAVKAVWIACTNPAQSMPHQAHVREALSRCEFVVLQEVYRNTETAPFADVLLPASSWGEKDGTMTNSERRITRVRAAVAAPGEARPDWQIATDFARRLAGKLPRATGRELFPYSSAREIFDEHRETTRGRDLDITGLSYAMLERDGPQQWPLVSGATHGTLRLYADGVFPTDDGRARFVETPHLAAAETASRDLPLLLNTGRLRDQWHSMTRTGAVARLFNHVSAPALDMHAADMAERDLVDGALAHVRGRRGEIVVQVAASNDLKRGQTFMPMHWGSSFMTSAGANALTSPAFDPISRQPELKLAAIQVKRAALHVEIAALARDEACVPQLQALLGRFDYATLALAGRERTLVRFRAWNAAPPSQELIAALDTALAFGPASLRYDDVARGVTKRVAFVDERIVAARFVGDTAALGWLEEAMLSPACEPALRRYALAPVARPPVGAPARGRIVCNCLDVAASDIVAALERGESLAEVRRTLHCGTQCGSCAPELVRLAAAVVPLRETA